MAGIRLGMLFSNPNIISWLNKIKAPYNISELTQDFAAIELQKTTLFKEQITEIKFEREKMSRELQKIPTIEKVYPSDANFILIKIKQADKVYQKLIAKGIVVRNRSTQVLCDSCLRITIGTPKENEKLIEELSKTSTTRKSPFPIKKEANIISEQN